jgi:hypothetical protein
MTSWLRKCRAAVPLPYILQVVAQLMCALWSMLRPGNTMALRALLILGKLGGASRCACVCWGRGGVHSTVVVAVLKMYCIGG